MTRIRFIHWNPAEAQEATATVAAAGYEVLYEPFKDQTSLRRIQEGGPDAIAIDETWSGLCFALRRE